MSDPQAWKHFYTLSYLFLPQLFIDLPFCILQQPTFFIVENVVPNISLTCSFLSYFLIFEIPCCYNICYLTLSLGIFTLLAMCGILEFICLDTINTLSLHSLSLSLPASQPPSLLDNCTFKTTGLMIFLHLRLSLISILCLTNVLFSVFVPNVYFSL